MKRTLSGLLLLLLACGSANAALLSRAGGQAYYDDVLNITWLTNANLADTNDFGVAGINANGGMTWDKAQEWIGAMNAANYLGTSTWRLPTVSPVDGSTFDYTVLYDGSSDRGYNISAPGSANPGSTGSEMAHMFYNTLSNVGYYNTSGSPTGCSGSSPYCLTNTGPFSNLQPDVYWSGTPFAPIASHAWSFGFDFGNQTNRIKTNGFYAWAVSPGDALVSVPGAVWMLGSALGVLGLVRRKVLTGTA